MVKKHSIHNSKFMRFRRRELLLLPIGFWLAIGCSPSASTPDSASIEDSRFKVALVIPQSRKTENWSRSGYRGLKLIERELGATVTYIDKVNKLTPADLEQTFRDYADRGFDFIIAQGGEFQSTLETVAADYPRTQFAIVGGYRGNGRNLGALGFRMTDIGYLFGTIAATQTQTQNVAAIVGLPLPDYLDMTQLFERGAKATNPNVRVAIEWVRSFDDPEKAREIAERVLADSTDVLLVFCGKGDPAVIEAATASGARVLLIDQFQPNSASTETLLATSILKIPILLLEGARLAQKGQWEGKQYRFGFEKNALELALVPGAFEPEQEAKIQTLRQEIVAGKIDVAP